jgi:hypothetical protein
VAGRSDNPDNKRPGVRNRGRTGITDERTDLRAQQPQVFARRARYADATR